MGGTLTFDATITIGNIAEIISIIGGGFLVLVRMGGDIRVMKADMSNLKTRVTDLNSSFEKLGIILTQVAVQDTRLVNLEKRLDELAHGRGFVQHEVQGEWPRT